uniref:Uncharacterized protein n=1 Tax=Rhizophora mucronata TaxID=61149 RepID=A0A2P2PBF8_RHIMU
MRPCIWAHSSSSSTCWLSIKFQVKKPLGHLVLQLCFCIV